jgi:DNA transformation protein
MAPRNAYVEFLTEHFAPLGAITSRAMFGGHCLYCDGYVFAIVARNALFLKTDDTNRSRFVEHGLAPFRPFEDKDEVMSYHQAPPEIFEDDEAMREWVTLSVEASKRSRLRRPRARGRKAP